MGGVIRAGKSANIYVGGRPQGKAYKEGIPFWEFPELSAYPHDPIGTSDDILMVGSSTLANLMANLWSASTPPASHHWFPLFRGNYTGSLATVVDGVTVPGAGSANTLGRVPLYTIVQNAENGVYPAPVNPLTAMGNYNVLVLDSSDFIDRDLAYPNSYLGYSRVPMPYDWHRNANDMNAEFEARMRLIRLARSAGVDRVFLCVPWSRWLDNVTDSRDEEWRLNCFDNVIESLNWQQDRLNYQIKQEGLGSYVSIVPFIECIKKVYDDIADGTAPIGLEHIRMLFANIDQSGFPLDYDVPKHGYMLNSYGTYLNNCLFSRVVYGINPNGESNTENGITVPLDVAAYFQSIATEIADTNPRCGRSRGNVGYKMPRISEETPSDFISEDKLVLHQATEMTAASPATVFSQAVAVSTMIVAFSFDTAQLGSFGDPMIACSSGSGVNHTYISIGDGLIAGGNTGAENGFSVITNINLTNRGNGQHILVVEVKAPLDSVDKYNFNNTVRAIDTSSDLYDPWGAYKRYYSAGHNIPPVPINTNRFNVLNPGIRVVDALICSEQLTDAEKFNYYRYLSKKLQLPVWEGLFPDLDN